jgi:hypothetical protein
MSRDYIPHAENKLIPWADGFVAFAEAHAGEIGLTEDEVNALLNDRDAFDDARRSYEVLAASARGACRMKDSTRRTLTDRMRDIAMRIQSNPAISDADRRRLGLSLGLPKEHVPLDLLVETPGAVIDGRQRLRHVLRITNRTEDGSPKARPGNAIGCEVWMQVGDTPSGPEHLKYVSTVSNGLHVIEFPAEDGGKQAHYMLRWTGRRSTVGSWSRTFSATIAA